MEIRISGKIKRPKGFVFVLHLTEDIYLDDVFILGDGTEIILREIKIQFDTKEPWTMMYQGWKCLCRFDNFDLKKVNAARGWSNEPVIVAKRKGVTS